ncbi:M4 family metallopeptidase [Actinokineospora diospyrosa]|uniref:M4 family metallopeptidase n=1 Tax=Actinokineospora diospyrosa TaxID=103728 RepID=UPI0020A54DBD|nr:M4 family metallopeptidase [Actinokineospora diospyrosa]
MTLLAALPASAHAAGSGTGAWNQNPVPLDTYSSGSTYLMRDPRWPGLDCVDAVTGQVFSGPDDLWGDGVPTNRETGCVDALYAAQTFQRMTLTWLKRNGADGNGRAGLGLRVGERRVGLGAVSGRIWVGYNNAGAWVGSLDLIGRQYGSIVDQTTPGGRSSNGTAEFIADAFGAAAEFFSAQTAGDVPDFLVGERPDFSVRNMSNPAATGGANCYSAAIPTLDPYSAAGVGDHWFALLTAGSEPTGGLPPSPTCNGSRVTGIGAEKAIKILYNGMLRKVTNMTYLKYRIATLQAALALTPGSCADYNAVKAAWNAVGVPPQPGEPTPTCT